jgi:2-phospho-L-lactate/phosphoenolpyruvate guanylyltransferase
MLPTAIVPVKRFSAAKRRLGEALGPSARTELVAAMLEDVLDALGRCEALASIIVVTGEPRARGAAADRGLLLVEDPTDEGHSAAATLGVRAAEGRGADCVALLPGDCPLLDPAELDRHLARLREGGPGYAGVIPDRHGSGTNGLLLRPPGAISPSFGPGSRERHLGLAAEVGARGEVVELASLALDLDTPGDLRRLVARLEADAESAPATAAALRRLSPIGSGLG